MGRFSDIKGNETAVNALRGMADSGRVPHAVLFYENPSSGGLALANAWIQYLNCEHPQDGDSCGQCPSCRQMASLVHPDVHYVFPVNAGEVIKSDHPVSDMGIQAFRALYKENPFFTEQDLYEALGVESKSGNISVYEAKEIMGKLAFTPVTGGYKAIIIFLPERMNVQAANKLLKVLEEPPQKTVFVMVTQNPEDVLSTIFSRCQALRVLPFDRSQLVVRTPSDDIVDMWNELFSALIDRDLLRSLEASDAIASVKSREKQKSFCIFASEQVRKMFLCQQGVEDLAYFADELQCSPSVALSGKLVRKAAACCNPKFCVKAVSNLDNAAMLLGRNVSAKMVFTDLVNRMFVSI